MSALVSVVVPNFNHARFLPRCLNALFSQTLAPDEIIVIDDASTDHSREVLQEIRAQHPALRVLVNEQNQGVNVTMNRGLAEARGEYVFFTAADDEVKPQLLERSLELLRQHPQAGVSSGLCEWRCRSTGLSWQMGTGMPRRPGYLSPAEMVTLGRQGRLIISGPSAVFRRAALVEAGGWRPELKWFSDWFGAYVVAFRHGMCHVPEVLSVFNLDTTTYYHTARSVAERRETLHRLVELLESPACADVAPGIAQSGLLGVFGWPALRVLLGRPDHRRFLTAAFARRLARRQAEILARRFFPRWLARACLRVFYPSNRQ